MNKSAIINTFNQLRWLIDTDVGKIKRQNREIMTAIIEWILKFEPMIKKPIVAKHTFCTDITFSRINSFPYLNFIMIQNL